MDTPSTAGSPAQCACHQVRQAPGNDDTTDQDTRADTAPQAERTGCCGGLAASGDTLPAIASAAR